MQRSDSPGSDEVAGPPTDRYDGIAAWYEAYVTGAARVHTRMADDLLGRLLGPGRGRCLDLGCGTGVHAARLAGLGWTPVGADLSVGQLRIARTRLPALVAADAARLPLASGSVDAVAATLVHTDLDDLAGAYQEAARVLRPGGRLVHVGVHPCFVGPFAETRPGGALLLHPGYRDRDRAFDGPGIGGGVRRRVGARHVPLADLLGAVAGAGLHLEQAVEEGPAPTPALLGLRARKPRG
jgi:SAM-dependent methyltransferase